jgi:hypothetical protein
LAAIECAVAPALASTNPPAAATRNTSAVDKSHAPNAKAKITSASPSELENGAVSPAPVPVPRYFIRYVAPSQSVPVLSRDRRFLNDAKMRKMGLGVLVQPRVSFNQGLNNAVKSGPQSAPKKQPENVNIAVLRTLKGVQDRAKGLYITPRLKSKALMRSLTFLAPMRPAPIPEQRTRREIREEGRKVLGIGYGMLGHPESGPGANATAGSIESRLYVCWFCEYALQYSLLRMQSRQRALNRRALKSTKPAVTDLRGEAEPVRPALASAPTAVSLD